MIGDGAASSSGIKPTFGRDDSDATEQSLEATGPRVVKPARTRMGVIADLHGYLDPLVMKIFVTVDHIVAAGDIVDPGILTTLSAVAPITAVSGASDGEALTASLPQETTGEAGGVSFAVGHSGKRLLKNLSSGNISIGPEGSMPNLVIWAGTHEPSVAWIDGTLFLDPGTASSPERDDNDPTVAIVEQQATGLTVRFVPLRRRPAKKLVTRTTLGFRWGIVPTIMTREVRTSRRRRGAR